MSQDTPERFSLSRWSRRKLAASREAPSTAAAPLSAAPPAEAVTAPAADGATAAPAANAANAANAAPAADAPALPPVESLSIDSDFTAFLQPKVDEAVRRAALRKLFSDPAFNVMDGLDVYIDDYTKFEPIPEDVLAKLAHAVAVLNPRQTRVNASGYVEEIPDEELAAAAEAAPGSTQPDDAAGVAPAQAALGSTQPDVAGGFAPAQAAPASGEPDRGAGVDLQSRSDDASKGAAAPGDPAAAADASPAQDSLGFALPVPQPSPAAGPSHAFAEPAPSGRTTT